VLISIFQQPTFSISTLAICSGTFFEISGVTNAESLFYAWNGGVESSMEVNSQVIQFDTEDLAIEELNTLDFEFISNQECSSGDGFLELWIEPVPVASILSESTPLDGMDYCIGQDSLVFAAAETSDLYSWSSTGDLPIESGIESATVLVNVLGDGQITLNQNNQYTDVFPALNCSTSETLEVFAEKELCEISTIYEFPGEFFIALLEESETDLTPTFLWNEGDPCHSDVNGNEIFIPSPGCDDEFITVSASLYGDLAICPCSSTLETSGLHGDLGKNLIVYPNPVTEDIVSLKLPGYFQDQQVTISLSDTKGVVVLRQHLNVDEIYLQLELPSELSGLFNLEIRTTQFVVFETLMVR
jgi:hypothetical protein